ncbi:MAG: fatty acid desaturase [Parvularculaceae bacterium]|nr:fatty acid desaturase [Parvularculaceae bacterium]
MSQSVTAAAQSAATAVRKLSADANCARKAMLRRVVEHCKAYQGADLKRSIAQASMSLAIYLALVAAMIALSANGEWGFSLLLSPVAGGVLVKLFTIQHDCGHGSYFKSRPANDWLGRFVSILTFTPYSFWRDSHNRHHAGSGDLDRRGIGAVDTLTVEEYRALSRFERVLYRFYRHPIILIVIGAPVYFFILQRLPIASAPPFAKTYAGLKVKQVMRSVVSLNLALVVIYGGLCFLFGAGAVALAVLPAVMIAAWVGTWLFFVQHQYEDAYWARKPEWTYAEAAIFGSSHYHLPKILRWFTGNIGLHHIHHLASGIPNYRLPECYRSSKDLLALPKMTILESFNCARLALWDEAQRKMIPFRALKATA